MTLDPRRPLATAVAVGAERVLALGTGRELARLGDRRTERIDCRGATVLPGLVDPHLHLFALAARPAHLDCAGFVRAGELLAAVSARAAGLPSGAWVRGEGLDDARLDRLPSAAELDRAAPQNPVRLRHRTRHASVLSALALGRLAGPRGIEFVRGVPSGLVAGRERDIADVVGPLPGRLLGDGLVAAGRELAALGLTAVADATPRSRAALAPLRAEMAAGRFPLRVYAMRDPGSRPWRASGRLAPGPVKILVEEGRAGLDPRPAELARRIVTAARGGAQVAVHCLGAATLVASLAGFAGLPARTRARRRHRLEHVAECPPPLVGAIAALGLTVVTNPAFIWHRGDVYRRETAAGPRAWLYRAQTLARAGIPLAGASDAPVIPPNPWTGVAAARTRRTVGGAVLGHAERLGSAAALALYTTGAARALHADDLGRLAVGGPADLIVVEPDPLRASPEELRAARVLLTMVGGEVVWRA